MGSGGPGLRGSGSRARRALVDVNRYQSTGAMSTNIAPFGAMAATFIARGRRANRQELGTIDGKHAAHGQSQANNLLERWQAARDKLPDGRRRLLDGILEYLDETVFLTSPELAARFDTDPATVVRTVQALG